MSVIETMTTLLERQKTEAKESGPNWKKAAEKLMKDITGKDQGSFHKRAYLRAVIKGNQEQATHLAKNVLDPKTAKDLRMKLIDLAGQKESRGSHAPALEESYWVQKFQTRGPMWFYPTGGSTKSGNVKGLLSDPEWKRGKPKAISIPKMDMGRLWKKDDNPPKNVVSKIEGHPSFTAEGIEEDLLNEGPTAAQWSKAKKVAVDPASGATYWDVDGTVWLRSMHSPKGVNQGSYEEFMAKFKAGKYASRIKLVKESRSMGLPKDWKRIAGIDHTYRGLADALHEDSTYDQATQLLNKEMTPIKTKGIRASWWIPGKAWAVNLPFQGAQIHTFTILPLFPGKRAYRPADPDRGVPEGIVLNPTWHSAKDFDLSKVDKVIDLIKTKAPSLEQAVDTDISYIEKTFGIKVPPAVVSRIKKGIEATAKRRWDANMLRQHGQLYPFDGGKPFKLDSWGSLKR